MPLDKTEIDRIDALISRCLAVAESDLESERRPHVIIDCTEKLTRIKAKMIETEEMHKRNMQGLTGSTQTICFDVNIRPQRDAD